MGTISFGGETGDTQSKTLSVPVMAADTTVLGCSVAQFLTEIEIIMRDTGKPLREAFALWQRHAAECAEERAAEARGGDALGAFLTDWMTAGMPAKKALCACGESDCPTWEMVFVEGRGFVDRCALANEGKGETDTEDEA